MRYALLLVSLYASQLYAGQSGQELSLAYGSPFTPQYEIFAFAQCQPNRCCTIETKECASEDFPGAIKSVSGVPFAAGLLLTCLSHYDETLQNILIMDHLVCPIACSVCSSTICYFISDYCPKKAKCTLYYCSPNCSNNDTPEPFTPIEHAMPE